MSHKRHPKRKLTRGQVNQAESEGWRVTEWISQKGGRLYVNLVSRKGHPQTVEVTL